MVSEEEEYKICRVLQFNWNAEKEPNQGKVGDSLRFFKCSYEDLLDLQVSRK